MPLDRKIQITQTRIIEWYQHYKGQVCVSFSGGKDSTVLLHIARQIYPDIPAVFSNTGLEYSSIQRFVKTWDNVDIVVPKMNFVQVVSTYGYPLIGKEVAEAIYYARRLSSQNGHVEREKERERERQTDDTRQTQRTVGQTDNLITTSGARNRRTILQGRWGENPQTSEPNWGGRTYPNRKANPVEENGKRGGQTRRRAEISGALTTDENLNRSRRTGVVGKPMNHGRETDGCSTGSEVPPG